MSEKVVKMCEFVEKLGAKCNDLDVKMRAVDACLEDISYLIESYASILVKPQYCKDFLPNFMVLEPWDGVYTGQILRFSQLLRQIADKYDLQDWREEGDEDEAN